MEQHNFPPSFPELQDAIQSGYHHCFCIHADGSLLCLSNPLKHYEIAEITVRAITCSLLKATLYLIDTNDGLFRGTLVEYWEHSSIG